jgi:plastocyanin
VPNSTDSADEDCFNGGMRNRVLLLALLCSAAACGSSSPTSPSVDGVVTVFIKNSVYAPNPVTVSMGQYVNWKNDDGIVHSATTTSGVLTFESGDISANSAQNVPVLMTTKGTINYKCRLHGETGVIVIQ